MANPNIDLARIPRWCDARVPKDLLDQLKIEADIEARLFPISRLRYTKATVL